MFHYLNTEQTEINKFLINIYRGTGGNEIKMKMLKIYFTLVDILLASGSSKTWRAFAGKRCISIDTRTTFFTRIWVAFVDIDTAFSTC